MKPDLISYMNNSKEIWADKANPVNINITDITRKSISIKTP
jgi:hypothetical protein